MTQKQCVVFSRCVNQDVHFHFFFIMCICKSGLLLCSLGIIWSPTLCVLLYESMRICVVFVLHTVKIDLHFIKRSKKKNAWTWFVTVCLFGRPAYTYLIHRVLIHSSLFLLSEKLDASAIMIYKLCDNNKYDLLNLSL